MSWSEGDLFRFDTDCWFLLRSKDIVLRLLPVLRGKRLDLLLNYFWRFFLFLISNELQKVSGLA
jgi:hypothetical protein